MSDYVASSTLLTTYNRKFALVVLESGKHVFLGKRGAKTNGSVFFLFIIANGYEKRLFAKSN